MFPDVLLHNQRPTARQIKLTAGVAALLFLIFLSALPFRGIRLTALNGYIPAIESLLVLGDLITAALLFSQASIMRSGSLVALATAYFFSSLALIPHALTFPDAFLPTGLLGARVNTSAWLYLFWRPGLPVGAIAYALLKKRPDWASTWLSADKVIVLCLIGATLLVVALTVLTTVGDPLMPRLLSDPLHWRPTIVQYCVFGLLLVDFIAIGLICRVFYSVLDLWLLLTLFTVAMELTMTGLIGGRFFVGWYVERTMGLFSGLLVLMLLLTETHRLYRQNMLRASESERDSERQLLIREATVATIAHELRQPLSSIMLNAEVGQAMGSRNDNDTLALFNDIKEESGRATEILESTRALFGKRSVNKRPSDVNQIVHKSLGLIARELKANAISVNLQLDESLPWISLNRLQMQEFFLNLFTNAVQAMSEQDATPRILTISCARRDGGLVMTVQDTGPGIPQENMEQIFDTFYTTKKNGTGVGLMVCHSIAAAHGGSLRAVPEYTAGAMFEITLPYDDDSAGMEVGRFDSTPSQGSEPMGQAQPAEAGD